MGQRPRSGDFPWLPAHSILNWIGGDISMLDPSNRMSSPYSIQISWATNGDSALICGFDLELSPARYFSRKTKVIQSLPTFSLRNFVRLWMRLRVRSPSPQGDLWTRIVPRGNTLQHHRRPMSHRWKSGCPLLNAGRES